MQVSGVSGFGADFSRIQFGASPPLFGRSASAGGTQDPDLGIPQLLAAARSLRGQLDKVVSNLTPSSFSPQSFVSQQEATIRSDTALSLDPGTAATLQSTEEINTVATSFDPFGPDFTEGSTAEATISGTYSGSEDDTLTFTITQSGVIGGVLPMSLEVTDSSGAVLDTIDIDPLTDAGTEFALSNGLSFSFSSGYLLAGDSFELDVFATVGSRVDPSNPFNGTRNENPNLEDGLTVSDGSFTVNGTSITVNASDSLQDVLDRINASEAGVEAVFDYASETIQFTHETRGTGTTIALADDTSGFLDATKLSAAVTSAGTDADKDRIIDEVSALSGISAGTITINGTEISIDPSVDSLDDVLQLINDSDAGVVATYHEDTSRVSISPETRGDSLSVSDQDTEFFNTLALATGDFEATQLVRPQSPISFVRNEDDRQSFVDIAGSLQQMLQTRLGERGRRERSGFRDDLSAAFRRGLASARKDPDDNRGFGFRLTSDGNLEFDVEKFESELRRNPSGGARFLFTEERGFLPSLLESVETLESNLQQTAGSLVNVVA